MKKIYLHYDMDAFFASIEQRDNPELRGIAIAVGHGVVTTASYEARKFGVKSAMPAITAKRLCPHLKFVPVRKGYYSTVGKQIQGLIKKFTSKYEFTSIDEGYIDITEFIKNNNTERFIKKFKEYIFKNTQLTCSVGIGFSKISAKIASDINKPDGYFIFQDKEQFQEYIWDKNLSIIPGIGKKTREMLALFKVLTVSELYKIEKKELTAKFGVNRGEYFKPTVVGGEIVNGEYRAREYAPADHTTISASTSKTMKEMLVKTRAAYSMNIQADQGYYIGGKTGTAQAIRDGKYVMDETIATYLGFGAKNENSDPQYVILTKFWEKNRTLTGDNHAMPAFNEMSKYMLEYLKMKE